jgi:Rod binding domain-containing protein
MSGLESTNALPAILPPEVRKGGKEAREAYTAAMNFEQMLVKQLTKSLSDSAAVGGGSGDEESAEGGSPQAYRDMISDNIATAITQGGGLGIAQQLYKQIRPEDSK